MQEEFSREYWEERYTSHGGGHGAHPNPHLIAEAGELPPGRALDAGCGEGADALWLAAHGWQVTAVDIAEAALARARQHEAAAGPGSGKVEWMQADLTAWVPPENAFSLVIAHYVHPAGAGNAVRQRLAAAVAPGGTLLIVSHHPHDAHSSAHTNSPGVHVTEERIADGLDPELWHVTVAEARTRPALHPGGHDFHDTVLRAEKRR